MRNIRKKNIRNYCFKTLILINSLLLILSTQAIFAIRAFANESFSNQYREATRKPEKDIEQNAKKFTVKILDEKSFRGSGVIINRQDSQNKSEREFGYLILTNQHVIKETKEFFVETLDGRIYKAYPHEDNNTFGDLDLALLYFWSPFKYEPAELSSSKQLPELSNSSNLNFFSGENKIYIAGFPCQASRDDLCETANFKLISADAFFLEKSLNKGRQVGYTTNVINGSSGGAVLNNKGKLIAINSLGRYSNYQDYDYEIDKFPQTRDIKHYMSFFSWGIPIDRYGELFPRHPQIPPNQDNSSPIFISKSSGIKIIINDEIFSLKKYHFLGIIIGYILITFSMVFLSLRILGVSNLRANQMPVRELRSRRSSHIIGTLLNSKFLRDIGLFFKQFNQPKIEIVGIRTSEKRKRTKSGWGYCHHTFPLDNDQVSNHKGFGNLAMINEYQISPDEDFVLRSPQLNRYMEIITYVLDGSLQHKDNLGNYTLLEYGSVHRLTLDKGTVISQGSAINKQAVRLLQIWIFPPQKSSTPSYEQQFIAEEEKRGKLCLIGSPRGENDSVTIYQDIYIYAAILKSRQKVKHNFLSKRRAWIYVARGSVKIIGQSLKTGDAISLFNPLDSPTEIQITGLRNNSELLLFDLD